MKRFEELTASDFQDIDPEKFSEWKNAVLDANKNSTILLVGLVVVNIILFLATGSLVLGGLLLLVAFFFIWRKPNRLAKELGIDRTAIKRARSKA